MHKRGQLTIFIIVGIFIVGAVSLFFLFRSGVIAPNLGGGAKEAAPTPFLESCIEGEIRDTIDTISMQGGYVDPVLSKRFKFTEEDSYHNISYLCYTQSYYTPCMNQQPMLLQHIKNEITSYISEDIEICFNELALNLEDDGFVVDAQYGGYEVKLTPGRIIIEINAEITTTRADQTSREENFEISVLTKIYDLAVVAQEIVGQEARFCNFEYLGYMLTYPEYKIDYFRAQDATIIYTVGHEDTNEKFRFAVKGCVIPPGL